MTKKRTMQTMQNRYQGCLAGLAIGDALGTTVGFKAPGTFAPMTTIVGGGLFGLEKGQWTDDTSMALCLAESSTLLIKWSDIPAGGKRGI